MISTRVLFSLTLSCTAAAAMAGPLDPPAGPVEPTMKTLDEVEPRTPLSQDTTPGDANSLFRITEPGSYYLTGNVLVDGKIDRNGLTVPIYGIELATSDVTIDLSGFTMTGTRDTLDGIGHELGVGVTGIVIRNGTVRGFRENGISIEHLGTDTGGPNGEARIEHVTAADNRLLGIDALDAIVTDCAAIANAGGGIWGGLLTRCRADANGAAAGTGTTLYGLYGRVLSECVSENTTGGGIQVTATGVARDCVVKDNTEYGIVLRRGATAERCSAEKTQGPGFWMNSPSKVIDCYAYINSVGYLVESPGVRLEGNTADANTTGFRATTSGSVFVGNFASAAINPGSNWDIAAGNACHVVTFSGSPAVSGASGGSAPTSSPWANFSR